MAYLPRPQIPAQIPSDLTCVPKRSHLLLPPTRSVEFVEERRTGLDRYLQTLLAHEQLRRELCGGRQGWLSLDSCDALCPTPPNAS